jgi:hypothetical protein
MAPPKTHPDVIHMIKTLWAQDPSRTAVAVWKDFGTHLISKRKVQLIVAEAKKDASGKEFDVVEWQPWRNETESSDDVGHLLRLDAVSMVARGRHLAQHEAKWGRRLRMLMDGLNPWQQYTITLSYGTRQIAAHYLGQKQTYTSDLDGILAYRPWLPQNEQAYNDAVNGGAVPRPASYGPGDRQDMLDAREEMGSPEFDFSAYLSRTSYWKVAKRMFTFPRKAAYFDRNDEGSFTAMMLDGVLDFWAEEQPFSPLNRDNPFEGEHDEGLD